MLNQSAEKVMEQLSHANWAVKPFLSTDISYWLARIVCPSYFLTLRNRDVSPSEKRVFSPPKYHIPVILTLLSYALKLCIRAVGGTLDIFFHVAHSGHIKISVTNQTQGIYCVIRWNTTINRDEENCTYTKLICTDKGFKCFYELLFKKGSGLLLPEHNRSTPILKRQDDSLYLSHS